MEIFKYMDCAQLSALYFTSTKLQKILTDENPNEFLESPAFLVEEQFAGDLSKYLDYILNECIEKAKEYFRRHPLFNIFFNQWNTYFDEKLYERSDDPMIKLDITAYEDMLERAIDLNVPNIDQLIEKIGFIIFEDMYRSFQHCVLNT